MAGDKFSQADAAAIFESISPGALAPAAANDRANEIHAQQVRDLRELFRYRLHPKNNATALAEAVRALRERYGQQLERDQRAKARDAAVRAQEAWMTCRDATPASYCEALKLSNCAAVATAILSPVSFQSGKNHRRQDRRRYMYMPPLTASTWPVM